MRVQTWPLSRKARSMSLHMFGVVHRTKSGKNVKGVLPETHAVVFEVGWTRIVLVPPEDAVFLRHAHHALDAGQGPHVFYIQRLGVADEIDLGESLFRTAFGVHAGLHALQTRQMTHQLPVLGTLGLRVCIQDQDHVRSFIVALSSGEF